MAETKIDNRSIFLCVLALLSLGIIMMFSSSPTVGLSSFNDSYFFIKRHMVYAIIGVISGVMAYKTPLNLIKSMTLPLYLLSLFALILTLIPGVGVTIGGASRWLNLGLIQIQPVEVMKFALVVFVAQFLSNKKDKISSFVEGFLPVLIAIAIPILILAKQPDLGNIVVITSSIFMVLFLNRAHIGQFMLILSIGIAMIILNIFANPYQLQRVTSFLDPWSDPLGKSYHVVQSFIAIGSGGIAGLGLGESKLKFSYLPLHYSDFIFSIICEEGGLILGAFVLIMYAIFSVKGLNKASTVEDPFQSALISGLIFLIVGQAMINIGGVIGMLPVTGIPLTFISFGGTSLVMSLTYAGLILNPNKTPKKRGKDE